MTPLVASVDLGGTNIACAVADRSGHVLVEDKRPTESHAGPSGVLERIAALVRDLTQRAGGTLSAVGMGVPGLVDVQTGVTKCLPNLTTQWREVPAGETLCQSLGCPVFLLNDVRMATLGELKFGHGREVQSMAFYAVGTGIGGGLVLDGRLRLGSLGAAGELGHQTIVPDGPLCGCGNHGCLETLASGPALAAEGVRLARSGLAPKLYDRVAGDLNAISAQTMGDAAKQGDEHVRQVIERAAYYLGLAIVNTMVTVHPELVVLGGGVSEMGDLWIDAVRRTVAARLKMIPPASFRIERSQLGDRAGTLGGIALAIQGGV